ncbi:putative nadh-ubiquinone oxidoreductase [Echria macrotheca]|uniref:NADH dehydrogenase [ubiquinone] 1 beta subcomplex subunit 11, mitochondrial n=1 Tax=Echria macrotheca TaxID=438768 RepID=A0AAJ0FDU3_9PEZI|nr:putative nadh-ubiquinone oxidoreductase [Echria macrotheca]
MPIRPPPAMSSLRTVCSRSRSRATGAPFSTTARRQGGGGAQYDPPTGWLFGVKPGEKYEKEGWENIWFYGFYGSLGAFAVAYAFKPDTSIQTWALEEARRRLEAEGILEDPFPAGGKN